MTISLNQGMRSAEIEIINKLNKIPSLLYEETQTGIPLGVSTRINGFTDYCLFAFWVKNESTPIIIFSYKNSNYLKGGNALITATPEGYIYGITGIKNGDDITINYSGYQNVRTHSITQANVVRIWGIV